MRWDRAGVEGRDDKVDAVDRQGEIGDELASRDEETNGDDAVFDRMLVSALIHS
jgi:hypothetical protein